VQQWPAVPSGNAGPRLRQVRKEQREVSDIARPSLSWSVTDGDRNAIENLGMLGVIEQVQDL